MLQIRNVLFFFIVVGFLFQVLGDLQLNRYVRFFSGIIFLLLLMSPIYEWITKEEITTNIDLHYMWMEYEEARNYDNMMKEYDRDYIGQAEMLLVRNLEKTLYEEGFLLCDYEMSRNEENNIETMQVYIKRIAELNSSMEADSITDLEEKIKAFLIERYQPDFVLEVFYSD